MLWVNQHAVVGSQNSGKRVRTSTTNNGPDGHLVSILRCCATEWTTSQQQVCANCPLNSTLPSPLHRHLKGLELSKRSGRSVPHDLTQVQKQTRVELAQQLLERLQQQPFLHRIITCDESWVLYDNRAVESQWLAKGQVAQASPKTLWLKKQFLCVWWGVGGVVHWELLPIGGTVNAKVYCQQLQRVHDRLRRPPYTTLSRMGIILQHDGAAPHRANLTQQKIEELAGKFYHILHTLLTWLHQITIFSDL